MSATTEVESTNNLLSELFCFVEMTQKYEKQNCSGLVSKITDFRKQNGKWVKWELSKTITGFETSLSLSDCRLNN